MGQAHVGNIADTNKLNEENYGHSVLVFRDRQAGISEIYDPESNQYSYNAYCMEKKLVKELFTCEYEFLEDALRAINEEFGTWELESFEEDKGCGSCAAKK
jgi:hypothetical protein